MRDIPRKNVWDGAGFMNIIPDNVWNLASSLNEIDFDRDLRVLEGLCTALE